MGTAPAVPTYRCRTRTQCIYKLLRPRKGLEQYPLPSPTPEALLCFSTILFLTSHLPPTRNISVTKKDTPITFLADYLDRARAVGCVGVCMTLVGSETLVTLRNSDRSISDSGEHELVEQVAETLLQRWVREGSTGATITTQPESAKSKRDRLGWPPLTDAQRSANISDMTGGLECPSEFAPKPPLIERTIDHLGVDTGADVRLVDTTECPLVERVAALEKERDAALAQVEALELELEETKEAAAERAQGAYW